MSCRRLRGAGLVAGEREAQCALYTRRSYSEYSRHMYDVARHRWHARGTKDVPMLPAASLHYARLALCQVTLGLQPESTCTRRHVQRGEALLGQRKVLTSRRIVTKPVYHSRRPCQKLRERAYCVNAHTLRSKPPYRDMLSHRGSF